ncbi:hypothetical protein O3M35_007354 [Rhynocoris fuscipes]|uniref:Centriolar and ciliogenesis-associated protein HYLS1 C-terminal domain-containing protein n=1 Tax=Rhynocoris fuscipes TaxID=488301 RepID=A0AAW1D952_9HEMI
MSIDLDPHEVLQHLYSLGYCNITKDQLKDFIKDLKKLIKYDLRKQEKLYQIPQEKLLKPNKENVCHNSPRRDTRSCKNFASRQGEKISYHNDCCQSYIPENYSEKAPLTKEHFVLKPAHHASASSIKHSHICPNCHHTLDCNQSCSSKICAPQCDKDDTDAGSSSEEGTKTITSCSSKLKRSPSKTKKQQANLKPCPSFIRPSSSKVKPPPRADPVALYHYYKTLWSQHTLPGENSHEDLRWRIRHKMSAPPVLTKTQSEHGKKPEWVPS